MVQRFMFAVNVILNREFKLHGILLLQTADSSLEFLKINKKERIKQLKKILMDEKLLETTNFGVEIMNSK